MFKKFNLKNAVKLNELYKININKVLTKLSAKYYNFKNVFN